MVDIVSGRWYNCRILSIESCLKKVLILLTKKGGYFILILVLIFVYKKL